MARKRVETSSSVGPAVAPASRTPARQITEVDATVGRRIRFRRAMLDLSSEEVAQKIGVAHQQLLKYENAQNRVSAARLYRLAAVLDVPVDWFFSELTEDAAEPAEAAAAQDQARERQAHGEELAELIRLYTAIEDADVRRHYLHGLRLLHRAAGR